MVSDMFIIGKSLETLSSECTVCLLPTHTVIDLASFMTCLPKPYTWYEFDECLRLGNEHYLRMRKWPLVRHSLLPNRLMDRV